MTPLLAGLAAVLPIDRDAAREAARRELSKRIYQPRERGFVERVIDWLVRQVGKMLDSASSVAPGGVPGLLLLLAIGVALIVFLRMRLGPMRRTDALTDERGTRRLTAEDYRSEAVAFAAAGDWREALRARFRAVIRELEQRGVLDERPGRTAGEIAAEASAAMPAVGGPMRLAADTFNEVWYGDRAATQAAYQRIVDVDESVRSGAHVVALAAR